MAANEMRSWGWLAGLVALGLAACLATAQERAAAAETNLSASTLPELLAAMLSANRAKGPVSIALSGDIYLDPDLLWTVPELRVDVALRGGRLLVDDVLAVCSLGTNVTLTLEGVALRYRRLVGLGTMFVGVVGLGRSGRLAMRNVTAEVTPRSFGHIEANLGGEYPAGRAEGIEKLPMGRGFSVASLTMGRVTVLESVFRATDESVAVWPEAYEQQVFRASQLVHQLRKAQTPDPLRPFRLTLARTMSLALEDVPEGPIQLRRKVVIRGPGEEGVGLYLFADLQGGKLLNVSQGGMLVFQDLTYDYQAAVPPTSQFGACTNLSCIDTDTMLPFTYDQSSAVCSYVSINTSMHTWCPFVTGLAKWLFLRQTSPGTDTTSSVVHLPGVAELAEFKAGDTESFSLASFIGSGTCVHNSEITCSEAEIDQSAGILKPPRGEGKRPELKDKPEKFKGEARTGTPQGIGVGVATAIGLVGVVLLSVTVFVFAVVLRRRIGKRGLDSEDGRWMDQPLAGGSSTCESEGSSGSPGQKSANHALQEAPAPAPVPMVEVDVEERGAGGGEGSVSMDPSSVSGGTLMERKWRELKEEMHKMNDDSVQLQEQIGSGEWGGGRLSLFIAACMAIESGQAVGGGGRAWPARMSFGGMWFCRGVWHVGSMGVVSVCCGTALNVDCATQVALLQMTLERAVTPSLAPSSWQSVLQGHLGD
ncbi:unnamed protein product [Ostreobium quekettii]|uniref:Uncharacterized protein n=1 Tax=Ostreobium quekettii TaxID=121088 RepID=A0A8S1J1L6_9CHLO|nr:unnamed protein product [Ostreobium quekettii]